MNDSKKTAIGCLIMAVLCFKAGAMAFAQGMLITPFLASALGIFWAVMTAVFLLDGDTE